MEDLKRTTGGAKRARLDGAGRKLTDAEIEEKVLEWIFDRPSCFQKSDNA